MSPVTEEPLDPLEPTAPEPALCLVPLGTNGFFPSGGRQTMSYLLEGGNVPLLIDLGSGISRLIEPDLAERLAPHDEIHVLLTHYHLDHLIGLSYLPAICREYRVVIHAPGPPLVDGDSTALDRLISPPLFPVPLANLVADLEVVSYAGDTLEVAGLHVRTRRQRHAGGSVGLVFEQQLAFLTDCEAESASVEFARGARVLVHEVWTTDAEVAAGAPRHGHSTLEEVATIARGSGIERLIPVHHRPGRREAELAVFHERLAELAEVEVVPAREGVPILI